MSFTNADALPFEVAGIADATVGRQDAPDDGPERLAYLRAWHEQRARIGAPVEETAELVRRYEWTRRRPRIFGLGGTR